MCFNLDWRQQRGHSLQHSLFKGMIDWHVAKQRIVNWAHLRTFLSWQSIKLIPKLMFFFTTGLKAWSVLARLTFTLPLLTTCPGTRHHSAAFEVSQQSVLHVKTQHVWWAELNLRWFTWAFTACEQQRPSSFPSPLQCFGSPVSFSQMRNVVITGEIKVLTPTVDLRDSDIGEWIVHVCLLIVLIMIIHCLEG